MSSQLEQLVGYLDREGVSEVVIGVDRPIAMRTKTGFQNLTARPVTLEQLTTILRGTALATMIPPTDGVCDPTEVSIGQRRARVQVGRRGDEVVVTISRTDGPAKPAAPAPAQPQPQTQRFTEKPVRASSNSDRDELPSARHNASAGSGVLANAKAPPARLKTEPPADVLSFELDAPLAPTKSAAPVPATVPLAAKAPAVPPPKPVNTPMEFSLDDGLELDAGFAPSRPASAPAKPPPPLAGFDIEVDSHRPSPPLRHGAPPPPLAAMSMDIDLETHRPSLPIATPPIATPPAPFPRAATAPVAAPIASAPPPAPARIASAKTTADPSSEFAALVSAARQRGASDLHIAASRVTSIRTGGELVPMDSGAPPLLAADAEAILAPLMDAAARALLDTVGYVDFALAAPDGGRLRANVSRQQNGLKGTFRLALPAPLTLEQLGLPADIAKVVSHHQGLVIIAGPSGHGKTTTLAGIVDLLNSSKPYHILTIEDPIEIVHPRKQAVVSQREAGRHTVSFARGLKASLREDPDVIVIGELRDRESVEIALTAAETGHLVIATMSTPSAAKTIDRLVDMFPPEDHSQVRASVAGALRAIVAQRLVPKKGGGIVPAIELVTGVLPLATMIREDKLYQLPNLMQRGRAFGMIRFDESLLEHVRAGRITEEVALSYADSKKDLAALINPASQQAQAAPAKAGWFGKKDDKQ